jgi:uncharacterized protein (TIGR03118 family)
MTEASIDELLSIPLAAIEAGGAAAIRTEDPVWRSVALVSLFGAMVSCSGLAWADTRIVETDLVANKSPLVDGNGSVHVPTVAVDANLVNPWGISESTTSFLWVADNGAGVSTLYNTPGMPQALVVSIPAPGDPLGTGGAPTGTVFNIGRMDTPPAFVISGFDVNNNPVSAPAIFLFATEDGTIVGWNPGVNPKGFDPSKAGTYGVIAHDDSHEGAIYKGLAIARDDDGNVRLYVTNFHEGKVDVYDKSFNDATLPAGAFTDPYLPRGFAPFNVVPLTINGERKLFVTYAVQDTDAEDDVAGMGHGIVDTYDLHGTMLARFAQRGQLNSPWGIAIAPTSFGDFAGDVLIGNFGNGHINVFDPITGEFIDKLRNASEHNKAIVIEGLWTLMVGNGTANGGDKDLIYFTAGPNDESDGLFGSLGPAQNGDGRRGED